MRLCLHWSPTSEMGDLARSVMQQKADVETRKVTMPLVNPWVMISMA
jgi:hypothetical protein